MVRASCYKCGMDGVASGDTDTRNKPVTMAMWVTRMSLLARTNRPAYRALRAV